MGARNWTAAELNFARTQHEAGVSLKEIARKLPGRQWDAIRKKLYRAGKKPERRHYPAHRWDNADDLLAAKAQLATEIAAAKREWRTAPPYKPEARA